MIRALLYGLLSIFLITLVRVFIGIISRALSSAPGGQSAAGAPKEANGGELKKCTVCGAYAPAAGAPVLRGVTAFICSDACADRYHA